MSTSPTTPHPTWTQSFAERAALPNTPHLTIYLLRLMMEKKSNLCLSADVETSSELLRLAEACGDAICVLKTHADIVTDFSDRTIAGLSEIAARKKFLIFEDRKFGDIGNTVQMQYAAGPHRIASWAHITNAHIFPGPAIVQALHESANSAVAAYNSTTRTEITGGDSSGFSEPATSPDTSSSEQETEPTADETSRPHHRRRSSSIVAVKTEISTSTEPMSPPLDARHALTGDFASMRPPLARGLLLLAQMSSRDNLFTDVYTQRCLEMAREDPSFVLGFIAQESLNRKPGDNFLVMTPGVNLPPASSSVAAGGGAGGDALGQQYNTPRKVIVEKGVDGVIVGRGLYKADDPASEAERYRREAWSAYQERIKGKAMQ